MEPVNYSYGKVLRGDTIPKRRFTFTKTIDGVTAGVNLTNFNIRCDFLMNNTRVSKVEGSGITIIDAPNGVFEIDSFVLEEAGKYSFDIEFDDTELNIIQTYIKGALIIVEDITK